MLHSSLFLLQNHSEVDRRRLIAVQSRSHSIREITASQSIERNTVTRGRNPTRKQTLQQDAVGSEKTLRTENGRRCTESSQLLYARRQLNESCLSRSASLPQLAAFDDTGNAAAVRERDGQRHARTPGSRTHLARPNVKATCAPRGFYTSDESEG